MRAAAEFANLLLSSEIDLAEPQADRIKALLDAYRAALKTFESEDFADPVLARQAAESANRTLRRLLRLHPAPGEWQRLLDHAHESLQGPSDPAERESWEAQMKLYEEQGEAGAMDGITDDMILGPRIEARGSFEVKEDHLSGWARELATGRPTESRFMSNMLVLMLLLRQAREIGNLSVRFDALWSLMRRDAADLRTTKRLRRATNLYLLGLDQECIVFCCASLESLLDERWRAQFPEKKRPRSASRVAELLIPESDRFGNQLRKEVEKLLKTRNEVVHPDSTPNPEDRRNAIDALRITSLVLEWSGEPIAR